MADNFIERIASGFGQTASVKNVFGDPIEVGEKKVIPVARIAYGFGGGYGEGGKKLVADGNQSSPEKQFPVGEGAGGGGGMYARAKGVFEIGPQGTRFIPAHAYQHVALGIALGVLLKALLFRKRRK